MKNKARDLLLSWLKEKNWTLFSFQKEAWKQHQKGESGLISVPTGAGKTYAIYLPALAELIEKAEKGLQILYITPLKALASDLEHALQVPIKDLNLSFRVESRTGDTPLKIKQRQKKNQPEVLLITPESLAILLTDPNAAIFFNALKTIIVDEWHELLGSKRGVLLELCLARLKNWSSSVKVWGLTATIGNLYEAAQVCVGQDRQPVVIAQAMQREVVLSILLPKKLAELSWTGFSGMKMVPYVIDALSLECPTLIFTNTRAQAEKWYQALITIKPEWRDEIALHHSSIDKKSRLAIEQGMKNGSLRFVVCTSSLDLGIDLPKVDKVIQIGATKSIARLLQRAGRASHRPLAPCHLTIVPTHALELIELNSYQLALKRNLIEKRRVINNCFDVLLQHLTSCAIGGGFTKEALFKEVKTTVAFSTVLQEEFAECLQFLVSGGAALDAYPDYKKLKLREGIYHMEDRSLIRMHKLTIGTISSSSAVPVKLLRGKTIGLIDESFLAQLKPGDTFLFAGRKLKLLHYKEMTAHVRLSKEINVQAAVWKGSRLPFSPLLGPLIKESLSQYDQQLSLNCLTTQLLQLQRKVSHLPQPEELLIEKVKSKEGWHLFIYPFAGKVVHEGLAMATAHYLSKQFPATLTFSCNDYGFEILSRSPFADSILIDLVKEMKKIIEQFPTFISLKEAGKSSFRQIAQIAGLVFTGFPGKYKSHRQIQISTDLIFEVLLKYDPHHLLIKQTKNEIFKDKFPIEELLQVCDRLIGQQQVVQTLKKFSPFSLPLYMERLNGRVSSESIEQRILQIQQSWERA